MFFPGKSYLRVLFPIILYCTIYNVGYTFCMNLQHTRIKEIPLDVY
jgi:hypothetical protein